VRQPPKSSFLSSMCNRTGAPLDRSDAPTGKAEFSPSLQRQSDAAPDRSDVPDSRPNFPFLPKSSSNDFD
jgi:hypothetical protein